MSSNLVIVAIPARDEKIWKVSSEQVPHMTLLFLGENAEDVDKLSRIIDFVEHIVEVNEHGPCMLDVDERGKLGPDEADVLFFTKGYSTKWFEHFRNQLLQQNDIRTAYDSTEQYPEWTPHLTLGYPETPANEDEIPEHGMNWITFDRIAVWTADYDGPEFKLKWPDRELGYDMAMSARNTELKKMSIDEAMVHFGIKGMKWGVRGTNKQFAKSQKLMAEARALEEKSVTKGPIRRRMLQRKATVKRRESVMLDKLVNEEVRDKVNKSAKKDLSELRKKPEFQDINYRDVKGHPQFDSAKFRALNKAESKIWTDHLNKVIKEKGYEFEAETKGDTWHLKPKMVVHESSEEILIVRPIRDKDGFVVDVEIIGTMEDSMEQAVELGAEFIEHFGIKGMKWGFRKPKDTKVTVDGKSKMVTSKKAEKLDNKFKKSATSVSTQIKLSNSMADHVNSRIGKLNEDFNKKYPKEMKDGTLWNHDHPVTKEYHRAYTTLVTEGLNKAASEMGKSPTGKYQINIMTKNGDSVDEFSWQPVVSEAKHAVSANNTLTFRVAQDKNGLITNIEFVEDSMEQTDGVLDEARMIHTSEIGEAFIIEHFGIKGMRWGFRRERPTAVAPTATSWVPHGSRRKTKIDVEGGENHPAHTDAIKVAEAQAKLKKSGPKALSNQELREVANRIQLENQVDLLTSSKGKRFISRQFEIESQNLAREGLRTGVRVGVKKGLQRAAKTAAVAAV